jgi:hypothetical protein
LQLQQQCVGCDIGRQKRRAQPIGRPGLLSVHDCARIQLRPDGKEDSW